MVQKLAAETRFSWKLQLPSERARFRRKTLQKVFGNAHSHIWFDLRSDQAVDSKATHPAAFSNWSRRSPRSNSTIFGIRNRIFEIAVVGSYARDDARQGIHKVSNKWWRMGRNIEGFLDWMALAELYWRDLFYSFPPTQMPRCIPTLWLTRNEPRVHASCDLTFESHGAMHSWLSTQAPQCMACLTRPIH